MTTSADPTRLFQEAELAFQQGDFERAKRTLIAVDHLVPSNGGVLHLSALVARKLGENGAAERFFTAALHSDPHNVQILNNFANFCRAQGDNEHAVALYDQALTLAPDLTEIAFNRAITLTDMRAVSAARLAFADLEEKAGQQAAFWTARARLERDGGNLLISAQFYDNALALDPKNARALHGRALVAMERGENDAKRRFFDILQLHPRDPQGELGLAQVLHEEGDPNGAQRLDALLNQNVTWLDAILVRAEMRWESGDSAHYLDDINRALHERPNDPLLLRARIDLMSGVDKFAEAADFAREAQSQQPDFPEFFLLEAMNAGGMGDDDREAAALAAMRERGWRDALTEARHFIRSGDPQHAEVLLAELRASEPDNIAAWGQTEFVWRLLGDDRHHWLHGQDGLYALRPLGLDNGQVKTIADYLRQLHNRSAFPVGQSLRGGTQTRGALLWRMEPEATLLREAIFAAVDEHWHSLPPKDEHHPLLRHRDLMPAFRGSWSVRLTDGGFHVSHIHPHGLLSSASYWVIPNPEDSEDPTAGHLEIGRPPKEMRIELPPRAVLAPKEGHLALFPSTLMHGTRPFLKGERVTMAFDVVAH